MIMWFPDRRFTVAEYHQMIQTGLLTEDDNVELLEGWIVPKSPRSPAHDGTIGVVEEVIREQFPPGWRIRVQSAITLADSEPEPDLVVVYGSPRAFLDHHPGPTEIAFHIEIADSSLLRDRNDKVRVYARAGITIYWIINLVDMQIEVYTLPSGPVANPTYAQRQDYRLGDVVPLVLNGQAVGHIAVQDLLP
jgi:hypothetical protein